MKIYENLCKSMKSIEIYGIYCFEERREVIFYILRIYTPHISVLQRDIICFNIENENRAFRENIDFGVQITYQSHYFDKNLK